MNISVKELCKSYHNCLVLDHLNLQMHSKERYCLMEPSGFGKTTLIRLLLGLEQPDSGVIEGIDGQSLSAVFQEDRLCEAFSPIDQIMMVTGKLWTRRAVSAELDRILPKECLNRPVSTLSGGMKRRVAICRALLADSDAVIMDEPFTGLDETTKQIVISYLLEKIGDRLLLISTHQKKDVDLLKGSLLKLSKSKGSDF